MNWIYKKIILGIILGMMIFQSWLVYWASGETQTGIVIKVTEKIPGAWCEWPWEDGNYTCTIEPGFKSVQKVMWQIIKWITAIAALSGVLFIVINGIMMSMWGDTSEIKKRIIKWIVGLILVLLSWVILNMIAPWVYK